MTDPIAAFWIFLLIAVLGTALGNAFYDELKHWAKKLSERIIRFAFGFLLLPGARRQDKGPESSERGLTFDEFRSHLAESAGAGPLTQLGIGLASICAVALLNARYLWRRFLARLYQHPVLTVLFLFFFLSSAASATYVSVLPFFAPSMAPSRYPDFPKMHDPPIREQPAFMGPQISVGYSLNESDGPRYIVISIPVSHFSESSFLEVESSNRSAGLGNEQRFSFQRINPTLERAIVDTLAHSRLGSSLNEKGEAARGCEVTKLALQSVPSKCILEGPNALRLRLHASRLLTDLSEADLQTAKVSAYEEALAASYSNGSFQVFDFAQEVVRPFVGSMLADEDSLLLRGSDVVPVSSEFTFSQKDRTYLPRAIIETVPALPKGRFVPFEKGEFPPDDDGLITKALGGLSRAWNAVWDAVEVFRIERELEIQHIVFDPIDPMVVSYSVTESTPSFAYVSSRRDWEGRRPFGLNGTSYRHSSHIPDSSRLAILSANGENQVWQVSKGEMSKFLSSTDHEVESVKLGSRDGLTFSLLDVGLKGGHAHGEALVYATLVVPDELSVEQIALSSPVDRLEVYQRNGSIDVGESLAMLVEESLGALFELVKSANDLIRSAFVVAHKAAEQGRFGIVSLTDMTGIGPKIEISFHDKTNFSAFFVGIVLVFLFPIICVYQACLRRKETRAILAKSFFRYSPW